MKTILTTLGVWLIATASLFAVDVKIKVDKTEATALEKVVIQVTIDQRLTEEQLAKLGRKLSAERARGFKRTFIQYRLQDQESTVWGVTNFTPEAKEFVAINGLTPQSFDKLHAETYRASGDVIGDWILDVPPERLLIYRLNGKLVKETRFGEESSLIEPLSEKSEGKRTLYLCKDRPTDETTFEVNALGRLEIRDLRGKLFSIGSPTHPEEDQKRIEKREEARKKSEAASKLVEDEKKAGIQLKLGANLRENGNAKAALKYFRKVVDEWPETKAADTARGELKKLGEK